MNPSTATAMLVTMASMEAKSQLHSPAPRQHQDLWGGRSQNPPLRKLWQWLGSGSVRRGHSGATQGLTDLENTVGVQPRSESQAQRKSVSSASACSRRRRLTSPSARGLSKLLATIGALFASLAGLGYDRAGNGTISGSWTSPPLHTTGPAGEEDFDLFNDYREGTHCEDDGFRFGGDVGGQRLDSASAPSTYLASPKASLTPALSACACFGRAAAARLHHQQIPLGRFPRAVT